MLKINIFHSLLAETSDLFTVSVYYIIETNSVTDLTSMIDMKKKLVI